jgi:hypothetical protein
LTFRRHLIFDGVSADPRHRLRVILTGGFG